MGGTLTHCGVDERSLRGVTVTFGSGGLDDAGSGGQSGEGSAKGGSENAGQTGQSGQLGAGGTTSVGGGGQSGASDGTGGIAGGCGSSGTGGTAGAPDERCPDLDANKVVDCDETLAKNGAFDANAQSWTLETDVELSWIDEDGQSHDDSGSLGVGNEAVHDLDGTSMAGARQCIPASGATVYHFNAQISVPAYAGETRAGLQILFFDNVSCTGTLLDYPTSPLVKGEDWQATELIFLSRPTTKSIAVRLVSVKPFRQSPVPVLFDNVLVRAE